MRGLVWLVSGTIGWALALPGSVLAQSDAVLLQIRPRAGDTLRVRLDQTVEMTGTVRGSAGPSMSESSSLVVLTRLYVETADLDGVSVVAFTDSVRLTSAPNSASGTMLAWARAAQGHRFRFRVSTDGSTSAGDGIWGERQQGAMLAQMPATLPRRPITTGTTWTSAMDVPLAGTTDGKGTTTLTATFRFDSLSRSGELAFLSVRGRLSRSATGTRDGAASISETSGTMTGSVLVDRRRGWITDARTTIALRSLVIPAAKEKPPMRVQVTISQWMRVM
ncbi:MAG TPA: hypothetical protein VLE53_02570 [Gemmatimonadaceae bacterium]|nr:hypothetical protein [Gemmatimonadaceae bacterium]